MTPQEVADIERWIHIFLVISAICTTAFPAIWLFSPWFSTLLGRLLMLQSVALALAIDVTAYFQFFTWGADNLTLILVLNAVIFGLIALASVSLTVVMIRMNYFGYKDNKEHPDDKPEPRAR